MIIDELNRLLENADSKHHDTDATSTALWSFIDKQEGNKNFFFIGTMNRIHKLPKPYKDRIFLDYINFPLITDLSITKDILRKYLTTKTICLDTSITDEFLNESLAKIGSCAGRDLKKISSMICRINKVNNAENVSIIKKESITMAIAEYLKRKKVIRYDFQEETEEERQERHHRENMIMQQEHFVQQQLIQVAINTHQKSYTESSSIFNRSSGLATITECGKKEIASIISDEQRELYANKMKKTRQREAVDAEKKRKEEALKKAKEEEEKKNKWW